MTLPHIDGDDTKCRMEKVTFPCHPCLQFTSDRTDDQASMMWSSYVDKKLIPFFRSAAKDQESFSLCTTETRVQLGDEKTAHVHDFLFLGVGLWLSEVDAVETMRQLDEFCEQNSIMPFDIVFEDHDRKRTSVKVGIPRFRYLPSGSNDGVIHITPIPTTVSDPLGWSCQPRVDICEETMFPTLKVEKKEEKEEERARFGTSPAEMMKQCLSTDWDSISWRLDEPLPEEKEVDPVEVERMITRSRIQAARGDHWDVPANEERFDTDDEEESTMIDTDEEEEPTVVVVAERQVPTAPKEQRDKVQKAINALLAKGCDVEHTKTMYRGRLVRPRIPQVRHALGRSFFTGEITGGLPRVCFCKCGLHGVDDKPSSSYWCSVQRDGTVVFGCKHTGCNGERVEVGRLDASIWPRGRAADLHRALHRSYETESGSGVLDLDVAEIEASGRFDMVHAVHKRYLGYLQDYGVDLDAPSVCFIKSKMGSGKSTMFRQLLKDFKRYPRVLIVSCRQQFTQTTMGTCRAYGFTAYDDPSFRNPFGGTGCDRVVCQWESAHKKLGAVMEPIDLVIFDEVESLAKCATSKTNGGNVLKNANTIESIVANAGMVLVLDAFLTNRGIEIVEGMLGSEPTMKRTKHLIVNSSPEKVRDVRVYPELEGWLETMRPSIKEGKRIAVVTSSRSAAQRHVVDGVLSDLNFRELSEWERPRKERIDKLRAHLEDYGFDTRGMSVHDDAWMERTKQQLQDGGEGLSIDSLLEELDAIATTEPPNHRYYRFYNSEENDAQMNDFKQIDAVWGKLDVVIYSPKVLVGADCQLADHFDEIYVYASPNSVCVRDLRQMEGRVRKPKTNVIHTFLAKTIPGLQGSLPTTLEGVARRFDGKASALREIEADILEKKKQPVSQVADDILSEKKHQRVGNRIQWVPLRPWLRRTLEYNQLEENFTRTDLDGEYFGMMVSCGHTVTVVLPTEEDITRWKEEKGGKASSKAYHDRKRAEEFEAVRDSLPATHKELKNTALVLEERIKGGCATKFEKQKLRVVRHRASFKEEPVIPVNARHYVHAGKHIKHIENAKRVMEGETADAAVLLEGCREKSTRCGDDENNDGKVMVLELADPLYAPTHIASEISRALGLTNAIDTETELDTDDLAAAAPKLRSVAAWLQNLYPRNKAPERLLKALESDERSTLAATAKDAANCFFSQWHTGELKPVGKPKRRTVNPRKRGRRGNRLGTEPATVEKRKVVTTYQYKLSFPVLQGDDGTASHFPHTVIDLAGDFMSFTERQARQHLKENDEGGE